MKKKVLSILLQILMLLTLSTLSEAKYFFSKVKKGTCQLYRECDFKGKSKTKEIAVDQDRANFVFNKGFLGIRCASNVQFEYFSEARNDEGAPFSFQKGDGYVDLCK